MNILQINTADTKGGAGKVAYRLQHELQKQGHESTFLVSRKYSQDNNVKLIRPDNNFRRRILKKITYYLANDLDFFPSKRIFKMPEFKNADIVHCHNLHTNYFNLNTLIKISALRPVVWTFHDMWPMTAHCAHPFDGALKKNGFFACPGLNIYPPIAWHNEKYLENKKARIYANSNFHIVTPSKWLADKVKQSTLKDKPLSVIYNGIDTSVFKPQAKQKCRQLLGLPVDKSVVLIVAKRGQSNPWKGGNYAQEAMRTLNNDPRIFFVDLGGEEDASQTQKNLKLVSFVADEAKLAQYYCAADMLLYPSIADNCPLVVLEAMACGLPIVSFNTGGIPELVEHKINGYIAKYKNSNDLKNGIDYLLNLSSREIEKMKQYSINKIRSSFTVEKMTNQYIELYKKLKTPEGLAKLSEPLNG